MLMNCSMVSENAKLSHKGKGTGRPSELPETDEVVVGAVVDVVNEKTVERTIKRTKSKLVPPR